MGKIKWEKVGIYIACLSLLIMFWQTERESRKEISDLKERIAEKIAKLEVKMDFLLEGKKP